MFVYKAAAFGYNLLPFQKPVRGKQGVDSAQSARLRQWGAGLGLLALMLSGAYFYAASGGTAEPLAYPDPAVSLPAEPPFAPAFAAAQAAVAERMAAALTQVLDRRMEDWLQRDQEAADAQSQAQRLAVEAWRTELAEHLEAQTRQGETLGRRLEALGDEVRQLRELQQVASEPVASEPAFSLRGLEVWHGQVYALLEHEGRVLPVRQGESRLGWHVRDIDREQQRVRVGKGAVEHVLEMP